MAWGWILRAIAATTRAVSPSGHGIARSGLSRQLHTNRVLPTTPSAGLALRREPCVGHVLLRGSLSRQRHVVATSGPCREAPPPRVLTKMAAREEARAVLMVPPRCVQQQLDRGAFTRRVPLAALRIHPRHCQAFMGALADVLLNVPKKRNILQEAGPDGKPRRDSRLLLMCPSVPHMEQLPEDLLAFARAHAAEAATHELVLDYEHWSVEQILRAALPADMREVTSAFESVGHIAHMNLRDEHHPYRQMIGQVILDKNKHIKTVVNKLASIDATFRFFKMEVIAGEDRLEAQVRESGCIFSFDFSKVYWNSRLHTEHERLVRLVRPEDVLCDMTAGVGPFALPAAKKGCRVYANDLNPESFKSLVGNIALNKANGSVHPYNMDARAFPRHMLDLADTDPEQYPPFTHAIINLPASGINFLDTFV